MLLIVAGLGMRSIIKIESPNTTLQTLLKEFCEKNNISPERYGLTHNKKNLDLSLRKFKIQSILNIFVVIMMNTLPMIGIISLPFEWSI